MLDVTRFLLIHYFVLFQQDELFRVPAQAYCSATEREKLESEKEANSEERQKKVVLVDSLLQQGEGLG
jgi:hypothetical protein